MPALPSQLGGDPRPAVRRNLESDSLDGVSQVHVELTSIRLGIDAVERGPADVAQFAHSHHRHRGAFLALILDELIRRGFPVSACSIRCCSMRCKHPFKKSISTACCPTLRSSCATFVSSHRRFPTPGNAFAGPWRNSFRQRCSTFGLTSNARATSATEDPASNCWIAANFSSRVKLRRVKPMNHCSIHRILTLNCLSQNWGQVHKSGIDGAIADGIATDMLTYRSCDAE